MKRPLQAARTAPVKRIECAPLHAEWQLTGWQSRTMAQQLLAFPMSSWPMPDNLWRCRRQAAVKMRRPPEAKKQHAANAAQQFA